MKTTSDTNYCSKQITVYIFTLILCLISLSNFSVKGINILTLSAVLQLHSVYYFIIMGDRNYEKRLKCSRQQL